MSEDNDDDTAARHASWGHRNAATILSVTMFALLALVMVIQVAC